ncbi:MAG: helix-turn-helix domain-containing protein [Gemmatimonadaceae bacterium]
MPRPPLPFRLKSPDAKVLDKLLHGGVQQVRVVLRAMALRQLSRGTSAPEVAKLVSLTPQAIRRMAHRYRRGGLKSALYERPRPGAHEVLARAEKQRIVAMACSTPPPGAARWTVRLIAHEAVKRGLVPRVGRETIRVLLQSHDLKPWRGKNVVHS